MIKDKIKNCLEENIILWQTEANSLPKIKFDEYTYEKSNLYVGDSDTEGRIQWHYTPVSRVLDFSDLEMESHIVLPQDLKDYYNAYFFLELNGFIDGECISFDPIDEIDDVLENLAYFMSGEEDEKFGTTNLIILGIYGHIVANQSGGSGSLDGLNGFVQSMHINRGEFRDFQVEINSNVSKNNKASQFVTLEYKTGEYIPYNIIYDVSYTNGVSKSQPFNN